MGVKWCNEYDVLAKYNAECSRGIMHTKEFNDRMKKVQERYNKEKYGNQYRDSKSIIIK